MKKNESGLSIWVKDQVNHIFDKLPHDKQLLAMGYLAGLAAEATLQEEEQPEQQTPAP